MCPMMDRNLRRCDSHLRLASITDAFSRCVVHFSRCPIYQELLGIENRSLTREPAAAVPKRLAS